MWHIPVLFSVFRRPTVPPRHTYIDFNFFVNNARIQNMTPSFNISDNIIHQTLVNNIPYTTRYGTIFIYHALFAALAWALLAPLSHLIAHLKTSTKFSVHRGAMVTAASLTALSYMLGYFNAKATPSQHAILTNALVFAVALQTLAGTLRPDAGDYPWRRAWVRVHRTFGVFVLVFAFFVVAHSLSVFEVDGWVHAVIVAMLVLGACAGFVTLVSGFMTMLKKGQDVEAKELVDSRPLLEEEACSDV